MNNDPFITSPRGAAARSPGRFRAPYIAVGLLSIVGAIVCCWFMAVKVREYNRDEKRIAYAFDTRNDTEFTFSGRNVTITTDRTDPAHQTLTLKYGDDIRRLRVAIPGSEFLPGLLPHSDWLRLVRFAPMSGRTMVEYKRDLGTPELPERLAIVTRVPLPGADPKSWGEVWIKDWTFEFYEFIPSPGSGFQVERYKYPSHKRGQKPKAGELMDNTWQFQAALQLMPQQARERLMGKFRDAMSGLSWTLPLATIFGTVAIFAFGFAFVPSRSEPRSKGELKRN